MNDQWTDRLSEYLDGELAAGERSALEAHLAGCAPCRATLDDLRRVVARARTAPDTPPRTNLWLGIHARLTPGPTGLPRALRALGGRRQFAFSVPQLLAASIALAVLSGTAVWLAVRGEGAAEIAVQTPQPDPSVTSAAWTSRTDLAVAELQEALTRNESRLDSATVRVVRENLAVIDRAIAEARRALEADPASAYLNLHLANTMRRKVELLRRVHEIAARS